MVEIAGGWTIQMDATDKNQQPYTEQPSAEPCVRCGGLTPYDVSDSVVGRFHYVEGSGQLCPKCWDAVYGKNGNGTISWKN